MAFQSFVGVQFAGVAAAVMIGKVARIQSIAQVRFSVPLCVRFGTGAMDPGAEEECAGLTCLPCPILEFRIINMLSGEKGGEIVNASVTVIASIVEDDEESRRNVDMLEMRTETKTKNIVGRAAKKTTDAARLVGSVGTTAVKAGTKAALHTGTALLGAGRRATHTTGTLIQQLNRQMMCSLKLHDDDTELGDPYNEEELEKKVAQALEKRVAEKLEKRQTMMGRATATEASRTHVVVDEGNSKLAPPRTYHKLEVSQLIFGMPSEALDQNP